MQMFQPRYLHIYQENLNIKISLYLLNLNELIFGGCYLTPDLIVPIQSNILILFKYNFYETKTFCFRMTSEQFESVRLYLVVAILAFRLMMMPKYLQSYLNMAFHKMDEMKNEAGKISNVELQKLIARVFYYLCVVSFSNEFFFVNIENESLS